MKPVEFVGQNVVFAKDQPEYQPLPAHRSQDGIVTSCWELTEEEAAALAKSRRIWLQQYTCGGTLQAQLPSIERPI